MKRKIVKLVINPALPLWFYIFPGCFVRLDQNAAMTCKQVGKSLLISEDPFIETSLHGVLFQAFPLLYLSLPGQFRSAGKDKSQGNS